MKTSDRLECKRCKKLLSPVYNLPFGHPKRMVIGYGYSATGFFCSLTCGHQWAVRYLQGEIP